MKKKEAVNYIISEIGCVPYFLIFEMYNNDDEIPKELIDLSLGKITENDIKVTNYELSKLVSDGV